MAAYGGGSGAYCVIDPIWHVSYRSGAVLVAQTAIRFLTLSNEISSSVHTSRSQHSLQTVPERDVVTSR